MLYGYTAGTYWLYPDPYLVNVIDYVARCC